MLHLHHSPNLTCSKGADLPVAALPFQWYLYRLQSQQNESAVNRAHPLLKLELHGRTSEATLSFFKASALWADAFYKSKCPSVCPSVCQCVCVCVCSLLRYRLTVFLPPLPEVGCPIFLEILNPWGKVMERSGLRYEHFCLKLSKIAAQIFFLLSHFFTFEVPFNGLFAPTSQSRMSNIFRDSESLGKSSGKKWSQI